MRAFGSCCGFFFGAFGCPRPPAVGLGVVASAATGVAGAAGVEGTAGVVVVGVVFVRTTTVESGFVITIGLDVVAGTATTAEGVMGAEEDSC